MTMFIEPLQNPQADTYLSQLMALYEAYAEFDSYCCFLHQAHEAIAAQAELTPDTVVGIGMSGRCLVRRSNQSKQQLQSLLAEARKDLA